MKKDKFTVVSSCNDGFAEHVSALFVSILENTEHSAADFDFYVIDDEISIANKRLMRETIKEYDAALHFLTIDKKYFADAVESDRIPETAYYRIAIPELFRDQDLERILYL
ncbi:MAG: glycosyltransferase family 8 protein, partial [Enterococcus hulanensis]